MFFKQIEELQKQVVYIDEIYEKGLLSSEFKIWYNKSFSLIEDIFGTDSSYAHRFKSIIFLPSQDNARTPEGLKKKAFALGLNQVRDLLETCIKHISKNEQKPDKLAKESIQFIENLCNRFPCIAKQICTEYRSKRLLSIKDEYDVQHLLHALLLIQFDDIRPEEYNPSCAGATSRADFLIKQEKILIEVKKTRDNLKDKEIGEQLIIDIKRYSENQDCKTLICFVYDPEQLILNPHGLESDLSGEHDKLEVKVIIAPKN